MAVRTIREILENPKIRDQIRDQTLTFAVLSQTMGVVTCGMEMKPGPFSRIVFQKILRRDSFGTKRIL